MKKQKNSVAAIFKITATMVLCAASLFSCRDADDSTHEVTAVSCVDQKDYNSDYAKQLNEVKHYITPEDGIKLTDNFARNKASILGGKFQGDTTLLVNYETFNLKAIDSLLCQQQAVGFRIYSAMDDKNKMRFVLVGVDKDGNDVLQLKAQSKETGGLLPQSMTPTAGTTGSGGTPIVLESGQRHPPTE